LFADAPTTPTTLSPDNNSIWFDDPTLTCSGSTDPDGDPINYSFWADSFEHPATPVSWTNWKAGEPDGGDCVFHSFSTSNWLDWSCSQSQDFICEKGDAEDYEFVTSPHKTWEEARDYCENKSGNFWHLVVLKDANESNFIDSRISDNSWIGVNDLVSEGDFEWISWFQGEFILQNLTSINYLWENLSGEYSWKCQACDNNSECSDFTEIRSLYKMDFDNCSSGNVALNFTGRDEETDDLLIPDMTFDAAWTLESAWDALLYNFGLTGDNNYSFCLSPSGVDVNITGFLEYDSTNSSYSFPRQYYFQDAIINGDTSNNIDLFQLSDTYATPITFTALRGATTVEDVLIHVQRYDPGTGDYTLVAMGETGATGQDIIYMRMTDAWYRILAYSDGVLEFVGDPEHILSSSYTIYLTGGAGGMSDYWDNWEALDSINYNLAFNESGTNYVTLTADDGSGVSTAMCLKVEKWTMLDGMEELYYNCESSASVTMSYEITDFDANYNAKFIAFFDGGWRLIDTEEISLTTNLSDLIGTDGIIYALLFIGIIAFVGLWNPVASVALTMFGLIISIMIGLISVSWAALIGVLITGGIILFKIRE